MRPELGVTGCSSSVTNVVLADKKNYKNPSYRSGANPLWGKKKHSLLIDSQGASNREIQTESGTLKFENGVAALSDDSRAKDIYDEIQKTKASHPNQYALIEDKPTVNTDRTHRMRIVSPGMPWRKYDALGRIVEDICFVPSKDVSDHLELEGGVSITIVDTKEMEIR